MLALIFKLDTKRLFWDSFHFVVLARNIFILELMERESILRVNTHILGKEENDACSANGSV